MITSSTAPPTHQKLATWEDYLQRVEHPQTEFERVFFNQGQLWIDMGNEGINHSRFNDLFTLIFGFWFAQQSTANPNIKFELMGGCVIEKPPYQGAAPDKVLYIGGESPRCQTGEPRRVNLDKWRVPDLVAEISDTTLASDLDEKKRLYLELAIPEYWVINVRGRQVLAFRLVDENYEECYESTALQGLPIELIEQTLERLNDENGNAALWFAEQIKDLPIKDLS
jgi:Uma2 family endonuclease